MSVKNQHLTSPLRKKNNEKESEVNPENECGCSSECVTEGVPQTEIKKLKVRVHLRKSV